MSTVLRPEVCAFIVVPASDTNALFFYRQDRRTRRLLGARRYERRAAIPDTRATACGRGPRPPGRSPEPAAARAWQHGALLTQLAREGRWQRGSQTCDVLKKSGRRFFVVFGLWGPSPGPGTVKKRLRMKNRSWGKGRDFRGPRSEQILAASRIPTSPSRIDCQLS